MTEVTSKEVGRKASRLLKQRTLTDADLADVRAVAASALTQRGPRFKTGAALAAVLRLSALIQDRRVPADLQKGMFAELEIILTPIAPPKS